MSPIEKISDIRRLPRLGKIRLGIKKEGQRGPYPQAVDYFVCPEEVKAVHGNTPRELPVMFPADDLELVAPQWYKCYSYSQGLLCKGDGKLCKRKVDTATGDFANRDTREWVLSDGICDPEQCPMIGTKQCRKMMSLLFILHEVPGLGVYQLDTSSFYSIVNMNSQLAPDGFLRHFTGGRIAFIPLILSVEPQEVTPPGVGRKTVHVLYVRADVKLADIIRISRQGPARILLPTLEEEEPPDDLYPEGVLAEAESMEAAATAEKDWGALSKGGEGDASTTPAVTAAAEKKEGAGGAGAAAPSPLKKAKPPKTAEPAKVEAPTEEGPPDEAIEGEGFTIDLSWLKESQKALKWPDVTMLSFIASQYKVSGNTVTEALNKLSREQAQDFTRQINTKVEKQPKLI